MRIRLYSAVIALIVLTIDIKAQKADSLKDPRDGNVYKTVNIGKQIWLAQNLNYNAEGSWCYKNQTKNCEKYGRLYNWETATKSCPVGWHLPSDKEWTVLIDFLGGEQVAGGKMKEARTPNWPKPNTGADNVSGFTALPSGGHDLENEFYDNGFGGYWWSVAPADTTSAGYVYLSYTSANSFKNISNKAFGFSVRCLKD